MEFYDFEYDGQKLSDYGLIISGFDSDNFEQNIGNILSMPDLKPAYSNQYLSIGADYESPFTTTFTVIKYDCYPSAKGYEVDNNDYITEDNLSKIMRWLNRKTYKKFIPIYKNKEFYNHYYMATFNISLIKIGNKVIGLKLELKTNSSHAFKDSPIINYKVKNNDDILTITDISDEIGYSYADIIIKCNESGDLKITNELDPNNNIVIKNCVSGEKITLKGKEKIIYSDSVSHTNTSLPNDFNYNFLRIKNTENDNVNKFKFTLMPEVEIKYEASKKVGLVL